MLFLRVAEEQRDQAEGRSGKLLPGICYRKPKPDIQQTPYEGYQDSVGTQEDTYDLFSIANTPEAQAYLNSPVDVDRGIDQAADLNREGIENSYNNAFMAGIPALFRNTAKNADINAMNQNYGYQKQAAERSKNEQMAARRERLLPMFQRTKSKTTGYGHNKGYGTQILPPSSGGLLNTAIQGAATVGAAFA